MSDKKIEKVQFKSLKPKIRKGTKYSDPSCRVHDQSVYFWEFKTNTSVPAPQQNCSGSTTHHCGNFVVVVFHAYLTTSYIQLFAWSVCWWYFIKSLYKNAHVYMHIPTHGHTYTMTHKMEYINNDNIKRNVVSRLY